MNEKRQHIWEGYDPKKVKETLRKSAGILSGIDSAALLQDIHKSRQQESQGRSVR